MFFKEFNGYMFNRVEYSFASYLVNPNRGRPNVRNENMHQVKWTVRYDGGGGQTVAEALAKQHVVLYNLKNKGKQKH